MNNKAKAIGMKNTHFVNPTVLKIQDYVHLHQQSIKTKNIVTTARDFAILDLHVIKETPKILDLQSS